MIMNFFLLILGSYLVGAVPFGLMFVRWSTGKDVRSVGSGRTGTTNSIRAAGYLVGVLTLLFDALKGAGTVWLASWMFPGNHWATILAPVAAILGHNYSIFLIQKDEKGNLRFRGGAGGATALGGAFGLYPQALIFLLIIGLVLYFGVGYASLATMSVGIVSSLVFAIGALTGRLPSVYILYGVIAEGLLLWALRPNIHALRRGTERGVSWRAKKP